MGILLESGHGLKNHRFFSCLHFDDFFSPYGLDIVSLQSWVLFKFATKKTQTRVGQSGTKSSRTFQFNINYDAQIFDRELRSRNPKNMKNVVSTFSMLPSYFSEGK